MKSAHAITVPRLVDEEELDSGAGVGTIDGAGVEDGEGVAAGSRVKAGEGVTVWELVVVASTSALSRGRINSFRRAV